MTEPSKPQDPFEFLKSMWGPLGYPLPGLTTPTANAEDVEKRIAELKSVESWLNLNLNVLRMTIQALEMQKASLSLMKDGMTQSVNAMQGFPGGGQDGQGVQDAWWSMLRQFQQAAGATVPAKGPKTKK